MTSSNHSIKPTKHAEGSKRSTQKRGRAKTPRVKNEPKPRSTPVIKPEPFDQETEEDLDALDDCHFDRIRRRTRSQQPCSSNAATTTKATCKPPKSPAPRTKRSRSTAPKDRSPLIQGDPRMFSQRTGQHWMDGSICLKDLDKVYMRPWDDCIPSRQLSIDNLPPFFVRLRDDQVGAILDWLEDSSEKTLPKHLVNQYWPYDINSKTYFVTDRENWGKPHKGKFALPGGPSVPSYIDMGLPPTFMSSGKSMRRETGTDSEGSGAVANNNKRKADEMPPTEKADRKGKRSCTGATAETDKIAALKADHNRIVESLRVDLDSKMAAITILQRKDEEGRARDSEMKALYALLEEKLKIIAKLESSIPQLHVQSQKAETKSKRHDTELQAFRNKHEEACQMHDTSEEKTKKEVKELRKEHKDTIAQLKSELQSLRNMREEDCQMHGASEEKKKKEVKDLRKELKDTNARLTLSHEDRNKEITHLKTELQTLHNKHEEERQMRDASEEKKRKEVKDLKKELKDMHARSTNVLKEAAEQALSYEEDRNKEIAHFEDRIKSLEAQLDEEKASRERCMEFFQKEQSRFGGREGGS